MSEIKVGEKVWIGPFTAEGHDCFINPVNELQAFPDEIGYTIIPDVPGLAALAAIVTEVGAEALTFALDDADTGLREWRDGLNDNGTAADVRDAQLVETSRGILRRLAAALEVKS